MKVPSDPNILASMINMKLRDGDYDSFPDLCSSLGWDEYEIIDVLGKAGFTYNSELKQFR